MEEMGWIWEWGVGGGRVLGGGGGVEAVWGRGYMGGGGKGVNLHLYGKACGTFLRRDPLDMQRHLIVAIDTR